MPSSSHFHLSKMVDWVVRLEPRSVLDVGVGFGKWGFLCREFTDVSNQRYEPKTWQVRIDGIEAFADYATPTYPYIYNNIYYGDVRQLLPTLPDYDLCIIGDVIEHFTKEEGRALLETLRKKTAYILLSSPTVFFQQELFQNPYETHRSFWTVEDFDGFEFEYDEFEKWVFVALLRGDLPAPSNIRMNGWSAKKVYSRPWLKSRPKIAQLMKSALNRLPQAR